MNNKSIKIWDEYYQSIQEGAVGNLYPNEPLIRIVSTIKKGIHFDNKYYEDKGSEQANRFGFNGKALEIGFGHIANLKMLQDKGFEPFGIEVSQESINRAKITLELNNNKDIKVDLWEPPFLKFDDSSFDLICGLQCIYYNEDLPLVIKEIFRCLKPNGIFAFSFFGSNHDYMKYIDVIEEFDLYNHVKWSDNHPNYRIRGAELSQPKSKDDLKKLFSGSKELRVFTEEGDFAPMYHSWWYVYGTK
jgi:SAM-dependent methyltransferase